MAMRSRKLSFSFPRFRARRPLRRLGFSPFPRPCCARRIPSHNHRLNHHAEFPEARNRGELKDALCLAVSLVTGPMIRETEQIARAAKMLNTDLPVVLGGWHPSLLPDQTLAAEFVDIVIAGQGEDAMLEVVQCIEDRASLKGIEGVGYKEDGRLVFNPARTLRPISELPPKAYHLADFNAYERLCGRRWSMYISSLACPYNCGYCTNQGVYGRKWNALEPAQVASEETMDIVTRATGCSCSGSSTTISWWIAIGRSESPRIGAARRQIRLEHSRPRQTWWIASRSMN